MECKCVDGVKPKPKHSLLQTSRHALGMSHLTHSPKRFVKYSAVKIRFNPAKLAHELGAEYWGSLGPRSALKKVSTPSRALLTCRSDAGRWDAPAVMYCVRWPGGNAAASPLLRLSAVEIAFLCFAAFSPPADVSLDALPLLGGD